MYIIYVLYTYSGERKRGTYKNCDDNNQIGNLWNTLGTRVMPRNSSNVQYLDKLLPRSSSCVAVP